MNRQFSNFLQITASFALPLIVVELIQIWRHKQKEKEQRESSPKNVENHQSRPGSPVKSPKKKKRASEISEAIFFPQAEPPCSQKLIYNNCTISRCEASHDADSPIARLANYILRARDSIDICQYTISNSFLADAIQARHCVGVKIRIVTDHEGANQICTQLEDLGKLGIPIRVHHGHGLMHNKYILIDDKIVMTGSFNLTTKAIVANHENVVITDNIDIVGAYIKNFEKLWQKFDPEIEKKPLPQLKFLPER